VAREIPYTALREAPTGRQWNFPTAPIPAPLDIGLVSSEEADMSSISNVGRGDATFRVVIGLVCVAAALFGVARSGWAVAGWIVGGVLLLTGVVRFCPAYALLGVDTSGGDRMSPSGRAG